ncbi:MAG: ATP-dependent DNA helicase RecG [Alphaproteobacteria bacterium]|nr:ATP-dependent DNA helicase RecG [Alphaproteobacteria bacterium]
MNNQIAEFLLQDLQFIKGIGPVLAARFNDLLGGRRVLDFILHTPVAVRPRGISDSVIGATAGEIITIPVEIISHKKGGTFKSGKRAPTQIVCRDKMGANLILQFFGSSFLDYWLEKLPIGQWRIVSGKLDFSGRGTSQTQSGAIINHPDFIEKMEDRHKIPEFQAIYPLGEGLTQRIMANARDAIFARLETIDVAGELKKFFDALRAIHYPRDAADLASNNENVAHLAYAELLAHQVAIAITRQVRKRGVVGHAISGDGHLRFKLREILPFKLTDAQESAIADIEMDMAKTEPMMRLIQGDVGSGKTIVAMMAALNAAEQKIQTALMAPTDTLAQQHYAKIKPWCDELGIVCDILTGRDKGKDQAEKLLSIRSGRTRIIIGTHALFQDAVTYKNLGLVIIDEQHRFGVNQRSALAAKGDNPDLLALSATPIPRTLSMTIYGDMDISIIAQKPAGRMPIKTSTLAVDRIMALASRLRAQIDAGAKVFWVCPLVNESEDLQYAAAETRYEYLKKYFPNDIGLVHGQMDKKSRDAVIADFANPTGKTKILVATSVIEVGIDVPSATIMIIENAEKFGLSALHQLRGRVGRGSDQSYCILMHGDNVTEDGQKRLAVLCETDDGFVIAEQDLMMRGAGELLGSRQSGWIPYHFVDYREHRDLFKLAVRDAMELTATDPLLESAAGRHARDLMHIFNREIKLNG